ncbi:hypothetical protein TREMEDRAFT_61471 [Tremella mesenterica DSM 1558]|uniref:uncharacterized protein n=1 Tax=Tremella mesenterica (strain ATCC 24925 / CBS 8224 / DSM 1558 / NBRC 9311 / NRRL Y-6157 / RJB 2259-6 / UBC 559-6) TaxID=578456 RepID=UPI0003F49DBA|nr:uncharacterized protein TREMEDRAFT_61471 [Tremella mesenterica DSM 1558]EIW69712.1 hypothetical protein TREMEDRAFT_61471 [Tremella mesenterica DSM 1558]
MPYESQYFTTVPETPLFWRNARDMLRERAPDGVDLARVIAFDLEFVRVERPDGTQGSTPAQIAICNGYGDFTVVHINLPDDCKLHAWNSQYNGLSADVFWAPGVKWLDLGSTSRWVQATMHAADFIFLWGGHNDLKSLNITAPWHKTHDLSESPHLQDLLGCLENNRPIGLNWAVQSLFGWVIQGSVTQRFRNPWGGEYMRTYLPTGQPIPRPELEASAHNVSQSKDALSTMAVGLILLPTFFNARMKGLRTHSPWMCGIRAMTHIEHISPASEDLPRGTDDSPLAPLIAPPSGPRPRLPPRKNKPPSADFDIEGPCICCVGLIDLAEEMGKLAVYIEALGFRVRGIMGNKLQISIWLEDAGDTEHATMALNAPATAFSNHWQTMRTFPDNPLPSISFLLADDLLVHSLADCETYAKAAAERVEQLSSRATQKSSHSAPPRSSTNPRRLTTPPSSLPPQDLFYLCHCMTAPNPSQPLSWGLPWGGSQPQQLPNPRWGFQEQRRIPCSDHPAYDPTSGGRVWLYFRSETDDPQQPFDQKDGLEIDWLFNSALVRRFQLKTMDGMLPFKKSRTGGIANIGMGAGGSVTATKRQRIVQLEDFWRLYKIIGSDLCPPSGKRGGPIVRFNRCCHALRMLRDDADGSRRELALERLRETRARYKNEGFAVGEWQCNEYEKAIEGQCGVWWPTSTPVATRAEAMLLYEERMTEEVRSEVFADEEEVEERMEDEEGQGVEVLMPTGVATEIFGEQHIKTIIPSANLNADNMWGDVWSSMSAVDDDDAANCGTSELVDIFTARLAATSPTLPTPDPRSASTHAQLQGPAQKEPGSSSHSRSQRRAYKKRQDRLADQTAYENSLESAVPLLLGLDERDTSKRHVFHHFCEPDQRRLACVNAIIEGNYQDPDRKGFISFPQVLSAVKKSSCPPFVRLRSGYNILMCDGPKGKEVFGIVCFRTLSNLSPNDRLKVLHVMRTLDKVTRIQNNVIASNGASHAKDNSSKYYGIMTAYGWRNARKPGETIATYLPQNSKVDAREELDKEIPEVASYFQSAFNTLFPLGLKATNTHAIEHNILPFHVKDVKSAERGSNSLTVTRKGFSNIPHNDRDTSPYNFGMFFAGKVVDGAFDSLSGVSKLIRGGEFWWPELGVIVEHSPADDGWAEVIWRGHRDLHGTLACWSTDDGFNRADRWGSSLQITQRFERGVARLLANAGGPNGRE